MIDVHIYTRDEKAKIKINNTDWVFKSERGKNLEQSIIEFNKMFKEYAHYYLGTDLNNKYTQSSIEELERTLLIDDILTKKDFEDNVGWYVEKNIEEWYFYQEEYRGVILDHIHFTDDFKMKRFWAEHYNSLHLADMDNFLRDFYFYSKVKKKLYSQNYVDLVKYDEYIIYQNEYLNMLITKKTKDEKVKKNNNKNKKTYILKDNNTGYYKIGKSVDPLNREKTLQSEKPTYQMIKVFNKDVEYELHKKYNNQRQRGEWFDLTRTQVKYICTHY